MLLNIIKKILFILLELFNFLFIILSPQRDKKRKKKKEYRVEIKKEHFSAEIMGRQLGSSMRLEGHYLDAPCTKPLLINKLSSWLLTFVILHSNFAAKQFSCFLLLIFSIICCLILLSCTLILFSIKTMNSLFLFNKSLISV